MSHWIELACPKCRWSEVCGPAAVADRLRAVGRLRRDQQPELAILHELLKSFCGQLDCPECNERGLVASPVASDESEWPEARSCQACGDPIPAQRLAALPHATLCAACQGASERGEGPTEVEYCPRCGAAMEMQLSRAGGLAHYVMACTGNPPCRASRR